MDNEQKEKEINSLIKKSLKELIEYIKNSIDIIISIKLNEEIEKNKQSTKLNSAKQYELLLQKEEQNNREHISIEHQFRIQCEKYATEIDALEEEKIVLLFQIVRIILINLINLNKLLYRNFKKMDLMKKYKN